MTDEFKLVEIYYDTHPGCKCPAGMHFRLKREE